MSSRAFPHFISSASLVLVACAEPEPRPVVPIVASVTVAPIPSSPRPPRAPPPDAAAILAQSIEHEPCDVRGPGATSIDLNGDGRADAVRVMEDGREICRTNDFDMDGRPDETRYFFPDGGLRRLESDLDGDGIIDHVLLLTSGPSPRCTMFTDRDADGRTDDVAPVDCPRR